jgi:hypothetical protein
MFLLTGCVSAEFGSTFEQNGAALHSLEVSVPSSALDESDTTNGTRFFDEVVEQATNAGLTVERTQDGDQTTVRITTLDEDATDVGAGLNRLLNASGINPAPGISAPFTGTFRRESHAFGGTTYSLDLHVDGMVLLDSIVALLRSSGASRSVQEIQDNLTTTYTATLPGAIRDTNGQEVAVDTVRWTISLESQTRLEATARSSSATSTILFVAGGLLLALLVAAIGVLAGVMLINRRPVPARGHGLPDETHALPLNPLGVWISAHLNRPLQLLGRRFGNSGAKPDARTRNPEDDIKPASHG